MRSLSTISLVALGAIIAFPGILAGVVSPLARSTDAVAFVVPTLGGGDWLDSAAPPLGEPLNVIVSGLSSPQVLTDDGFLNWAQSLGFSFTCLGIQLGGPQSANLGDGNGFVNQTTELREDFGDALLGTCLESLIGGNHLRMFRQNGPDANTGALFLAVSREDNLADNHDIIPNGYNIGRDELAGNATLNPSFGGVDYSNTVVRLANEMPSGSAGVNHGIAVDGTVVLITVEVTN